jgi:hypothetical protein
MESLRITRLFPVVGAMDDKMRYIMIWITLAVLAVLAGVESSLAFMGDQISQNIQALRLTLAPGANPTTVIPNRIPTVGQMIIGFLLPFVLAFVAIPLEAFVSAARTVLGIIVAGALRFLAFILRLIGNMVYYLGRLIVNLYDLIIFPSIWLEGVIAGPRVQNIETAGNNQIYEKKAVPEESMDNVNEKVSYAEQKET